MRFLFGMLLALTGLVPAWAEPPDARALMKSFRVDQAEVDSKFTGHLRVGSSSKKTPLVLTISKGVTRYDFPESNRSIILRVGENGSTLEEVTKGKVEAVPPQRLGQLIPDTAITYEDVALRFLYWPEARVEGSDTILGQDSWRIRIEPPRPGMSQYGSVRVWLTRQGGAMMKMESYDASGRMVRTYTVRKGMKRNNQWFLKLMEIETTGVRKRTYLELVDVIE